MITANMVKELREQTGAGMLDCKKALTETNGNMEEAITWLREKGISKAAKKQTRIAAEGLATAKISGNNAVLVEVNSETDFVAKNPEFVSLVDGIANVILDKKPANMEEAMKLELDGTSIEEAIVNKTITSQTVNKKPLEVANTKSDGNNTFMVKVIVDALNIRRGPGVNNSIVGCITDKGAYTIVDVNGSWGRLKSGAGWINTSSAYCKRI